MLHISLNWYPDGSVVLNQALLLLFRLLMLVEEEMLRKVASIYNKLIC